MVILGSFFIPFSTAEDFSPEQVVTIKPKVITLLLQCWKSQMNIILDDHIQVVMIITLFIWILFLHITMEMIHFSNKVIILSAIY